MRPSDLLLDFGRPVAYYPGLVKVMGSPHAVIFFSQIFLQRIQTLAHRLKPLHRLVLQNRIIHLNSKQPGRPTLNALVAIPSPGLSKPGKPA